MKGDVGMIECEKVEVIWKREKKLVENKATLDSIIARFEEGWWSRFDGRRAGFGLRLDLVYQEEMMFGYVASLLLNN